METVNDLQRIKTTQMGILELFGEGWKYYSTNFVKILIIILCVYIPINTIVLLIPIHESLQDDPLRLMQLYGRIYQFFETWVGCIATVGIAAIVEGAIFGTDLLWGDAMRKGFSRWGSAVGTSILAGFILLGLTLLLIVPGIIWTVYYTFWLYVVALRGIGGKTALDYSKNLVVGQWWRILGITIVIAIVDLITGFIVNIPFWFLPDNIIVNVLSNTSMDIVGGLFTVTSIVFFLNTDFLKSSELKTTAQNETSTELSQARDDLRENICSNCGGKVMARDKFCRKCGSQLK